MIEQILAYFSDIPPQLAVFLITMLPIGENRVAIPVALGVYHLPIWQVMFLTTIGDIFIAALILFCFQKINNWLEGRISLVDRFFNWLFTRTEKKFAKKYEVWGEVALMIFVAIPLPVTGAWTGSFAAWMFGINPWRALLFISLGVILSSGIIILASLGLINIILI